MNIIVIIKLTSNISYYIFSFYIRNKKIDVITFIKIYYR